ncbi:MAG TPA: hypothetical protein VGG16_21840, partial [Streptosporangiaceae bacterium]
PGQATRYACCATAGLFQPKRAGVRVLVVLGLLTVAGGLIFFATASAAPGYGHYVVAMVAMSAATSASMGGCLGRWPG